jgi:Nucleoside-diphosphate-sugar pyrophosphorylase involved in lipopolysaccharide biosynthesis/translation initiation factor 2B, gamma/epsilon subunits (eIF-2Bgamma/eIF-2Bepsilon)
MAGGCDVIILCGGLGTRLRAVLDDRPKPMAPIDGRPFLDLIVEHVTAYGFHRFIFCTGHMGEWIANHFGDRTEITAVICREGKPLGTGGALKACRHLITSSTVLILNGDSLCQIDLKAFLAEHRRRKAWATVAVVPSDDRTDGGGITLNSEGRIVAFHEKGPGSFLNAGIYALESRVFEHIPDRIPCSLEQEVFPRLLERPIYAVLCEAPLHDIGTPARLEEFRTWNRTGCEPKVGKETVC